MKQFIAFMILALCCSVSLVSTAGDEAQTTNSHYAFLDSVEIDSTYTAVAHYDDMPVFASQFGKTFSDLTDIQTFAMNNHQQDRNNPEDDWGCFLRDLDGWMFLGANTGAEYSDLTADTYLNGQWVTNEVNPTLGDIDVGYEGIMWLESNVRTVNTGALATWSGWVYIRYNWNYTPAGDPNSIPISLVFVPEGETRPTSSSNLGSGYQQYRPMYDFNADGWTTTTDLVVYLSQLE